MFNQAQATQFETVLHINHNEPIQIGADAQKQLPRDNEINLLFNKMINEYLRTNSLYSVQSQVNLLAYSLASDF